ncbi:hypothetical protein ACFP51_34995 [Streptomyces pratens]|uniref:Uncharacterized protein n=1 Tax=Streptomyces pratens TaxID=887456 RepID=A0ABW1LU50_9ACTN
MIGVPLAVAVGRAFSLLGWSLPAFLALDVLLAVVRHRRTARTDAPA